MGLKRIGALEKLASAVIGDGKAPNLFFVSLEGNVILISRDFEIAYQVWKNISDQRVRETSLEDRQTGVLASVEPEEEGSKTLRRIDDTRMIRRR